MKKIILLLLIVGWYLLHAKVRNEVTYLVQVTNNTHRPFKIFCVNRGNRHVVIGHENELNTVIPPYISKATPEKKAAKNRYEILFNRQWDLIGKLRIKGLSEQAIRNVINQQAEPVPTAINDKAAIAIMFDELKAISAELAPLRQQLAPEVQGKSVLPASTLMYELPCRIGSPDDEPEIDRPSDWKAASTIVTDGELHITIIDTSAQKNCPPGSITVEAESHGLKKSVCVKPFNNLGKVHLIINEDGTFELKDAQASY